MAAETLVGQWLTPPQVPPQLHAAGPYRRLDGGDALYRHRHHGLLHSHAVRLRLSLNRELKVDLTNW